MASVPASATCVYSSCTEPMKSKQSGSEQAQHLVCAEVGVEGLQCSVAQHIPHTASFDLTHPPCPCRNALTAHAGEHTSESMPLKHAHSRMRAQQSLHHLSAPAGSMLSAGSVTGCVNTHYVSNKHGHVQLEAGWMAPAGVMQGQEAATW